MKNIFSIIILAIIAGIWFGGSSLISLLVDWNWFFALGHEELFTTKFSMQVALFVVTFIFSSIFIYTNIYFLLKSKPFPIAKLKEQLVEGTL